MASRTFVDEHAGRGVLRDSDTHRRTNRVVLMYRTSNVARSAGAVSLLVVLACWGVLDSFATGETTTTTWGLALASMYPVSAILLGLTGNRSPPRTGIEYAKGLVAGVVALSLAYLGFVLGATDTIRALVSFDSIELVGAALLFAMLVGVLVLVDVRYVERPPTVALLEDRYLDDPLED